MAMDRLNLHHGVESWSWFTFGDKRIVSLAIWKQPEID